MINDIRLLLDDLVPRGGVKPTTIYVSLEEYLSRLANFNRKISGTHYRIGCWKKICEENQGKFQKDLDFADKWNAFAKSDLKLRSTSFSSRDSRLENEFEMLLYSITSTLSSLTRIVVCFLKGSTQVHSHSSLSKILLKYPDFNTSQIIVLNACNLWADELTKRRDAATHYIALSARSFIQHSKSESSIIERNFSQIQIPKYSTKYNSLWEDELPTLGGSCFVKITNDLGAEINEIRDSNGVTIVKREQPLEKRPEFIEAQKYVENLCSYFEEYIKSILGSLILKLKIQNSS
jgi:hypothetical protein